MSPAAESTGEATGPGSQLRTPLPTPTPNVLEQCMLITEHSVSTQHRMCSVYARRVGQALNPNPLGSGTWYSAAVPSYQQGLNWTTVNPFNSDGSKPGCVYALIAACKETKAASALHRPSKIQISGNSCWNDCSAELPCQTSEPFPLTIPA